jgi:hypothetical protein
MSTGRSLLTVMDYYQSGEVGNSRAARLLDDQSPGGRENQNLVLRKRDRIDHLRFHVGNLHDALRVR